MSVYANWIVGVNVGFELYDEEGDSGFIIDLLIVRLVFLRND